MFSNSKKRFVTASIALALFGACGDDTDVPGYPTGPSGAAGSPATAPTPSSTPTTSIPPTTPPTASTLVVENQFPSTSIIGLFLSPSTKESWGPNQLEGDTLYPGRTFTLRNIPCLRNYDLKVVASGGRTLPIVTGIYFGCGIEKVVRVGN